jgi:drug/metabolite transporter (DMT)-like permease
MTLTPFVLALVLGAAILHASWNALLKGGGDRLRFIALMTACSSLIALPFLPFLPIPARASWGCILLSAALHVGYNLFLIRAYRHGDLGEVYPIARGSSPLLVTLGAALVAGEIPSLPMLAGIVLVSAGIVSLARGWRGGSRSGLVMAAVTGMFIAAYTVTDGMGGRASGDPRAYAAWLFALDGLPMVAIFVARRGWAPLLWADALAGRATIGGAVSLVAYAAVIWAASVAPMGAVSALRETSVVFAALLGRVFLAERLTLRKLASCAAVAVGAVALSGIG